LARLCAAGIQLRNQLDDDYPDRDRKSDGWIADARHLAKGSSDHIPVDGIVRALDIDADLSAHKEEAYAVVEKIRKLAKKGDKRIKYIIYDGKKKMAESWAKTFLATALATYLAVGLDVNAIANAALVSVLPSIINWLNPNYERYGRIK